MLGADAVALAALVGGGAADELLAEGRIGRDEARHGAPVGRLVMDVHALGGVAHLDEEGALELGGAEEEEGVVGASDLLDRLDVALDDSTICEFDLHGRHGGKTHPASSDGIWRTYLGADGSTDPLYVGPLVPTARTTA